MQGRETAPAFWAKRQMIRVELHPAMPVGVIEFGR